MKQIMVAGIGPVGLAGVVALPPELVEVEVDEPLIPENVKLEFAFFPVFLLHICTSLLYYIPKCVASSIKMEVLMEIGI